MPQFHTIQDGINYCETLATNLHITLPKKGTHMTSWLDWALVGDVIVAFAAYEVGKKGLTGAYTWVRNLFAKSTGTTVATPSAA